jgi:hypothetical protein
MTLTVAQLGEMRAELLDATIRDESLLRQLSEKIRECEESEPDGE